MARVLVACVGNIFLSDDGFGVEVATVLARDPLPPEVRLVDFGIRSVHLVYELMEGYDVLVVVDTVAQQTGPPGSLYVVEPALPPRGTGDPAGRPPEVVLDPHDLSPGGVMELLPTLGGVVDRILVVGCRPEVLDEGIGLSDAVRAAVAPAAALVREVVDREVARLHAEPRVPGGGG
jgi:hydrogenase maturation protease